MPTLDNLRDIASLLHDEEKKHISKILNSEMEARLFDLIIQGDVDGADKLVGSIKPQKLDKLIANLYDMVLGVPALGICIKTPKVYSSINAARMHIAKILN